MASWWLLGGAGYLPCPTKPSLDSLAPPGSAYSCRPFSYFHLFKSLGACFSPLQPSLHYQANPQCELGLPPSLQLLLRSASSETFSLFKACHFCILSCFSLIEAFSPSATATAQRPQFLPFSSACQAFSMTKSFNSWFNLIQVFAPAPTYVRPLVPAPALCILACIAGEPLQFVLVQPTSLQSKN